MCGIFGVVNKQNKLNNDLFEQQLSLINHRGPNDTGSWFNVENTVGLGSKRLAIQDLSANGHMPMESKDKNLQIVFNGEIYNFLTIRKKLESLGYVFNSNSDTEVVLAAYEKWGVESLKLFEGMFALAIFNINEKTLFLARDRAGEKPLYYSLQHNNQFYFGSELKPILLDSNVSRKLNYTVLNKYLDNGFIGSEDCFIENIYKLKPGHCLTLNVNSFDFKTDCYWKLPSFKNLNLTKEELIFEADQILNNIVKNQLISDVPVGVLLSGGVDSSLITAYAAANSTSKLKSFHVSFKGNQKYNEAEYALKIAQYFDTDHIEIDGNEIEYELIDKMAEIYSEPLGDSSMIPTYLVCSAIKQHVTVALGGDGGDELFGGYTTYRDVLNHNNVQKYPNVFRKGVSKVASQLPMGLKGRNFLMQLEGNQKHRFLSNRLFDEKAKKSVLTNATKYSIFENQIKDFENDPVYHMTKYDFDNYLPNDILFKVDQASMAVSLELRTPFLDKNILEFAFEKVPSSLKTNHSSLKILTKELLKTKIDFNYDFSRKQGFSIPLNDWFGNKWYDLALNDLNELQPIFNKKAIIDSFKNIKKGYTNSSRIYSLLILSKWLRKNKIEF